MLPTVREHLVWFREFISPHHADAGPSWPGGTRFGAKRGRGGARGSFWLRKKKKSERPSKSRNGGGSVRDGR